MNSNTLETTSEEKMGEKNIRKQKQLPLSKSRKKGLFLLVIGLGLLIALGFGLYRLFFTQEERVAMTGTTTYGFLNEAIDVVLLKDVTGSAYDYGMLRIIEDGINLGGDALNNAATLTNSSNSAVNRCLKCFIVFLFYYFTFSR